MSATTSAMASSPISAIPRRMRTTPCARSAPASTSSTPSGAWMTSSRATASASPSGSASTPAWWWSATSAPATFVTRWRWSARRPTSRRGCKGWPTRAPCWSASARGAWSRACSSSRSAAPTRSRASTSRSRPIASARRPAPRVASRRPPRGASPRWSAATRRSGCCCRAGRTPSRAKATWSCSPASRGSASRGSCSHSASMCASIRRPCCATTARRSTSTPRCIRFSTSWSGPPT